MLGKHVPSRGRVSTMNVGFNAALGHIQLNCSQNFILTDIIAIDYDHNFVKLYLRVLEE